MSFLQISVSNPPFLALTYLGRFWATDDSSRTTIFSIKAKDGTIDGKTITQFNIRDLTNDGTHLWASIYSGKLVEFGEHPASISKIYEIPSEEPMGIAWHASNMWIYDKKENLLLECDKEFKIKASYRVLFQQGVESSMLQDLKYLAFDYSGNLWASDEKYVYEFLLN